MKKASVSLFDYTIANTTLSQVLKKFQSQDLNRFYRVVTLNPEIIIQCETNRGLKRIVQEADLIIPDGIGLVFALKLLKNESLTRITGMDLLLQILKKQTFSIFLVGSKLDTLNTAVSAIQKRYPNLNVKGFHHGYFNKDQEQDLLASIQKLKPDIILCGMGFPKQELFLFKLSKQIPRGIGIGVGGAFDVLSGNKQRAPKWIQKIGLEWFFRAIIEPKRFSRLRFIFPYFHLILRYYFKRSS
ncbi:WecB/TagA/CpsF family glycosyltransferase [Thermoproteota archaeon]